jgi:5-methylcytosine-specific restriction endonuclease McrA
MTPAERAHTRKYAKAYNRAYRDEHPECDYTERKRYNTFVEHCHLEGFGGPIASFDEWRELFSRQPRCQGCGTRESLTVDHITPLFKHGASTIDNLQILCTRCNHRRKDNWSNTPLRTLMENKKSLKNLEKVTEFHKI